MNTVSIDERRDRTAPASRVGLAWRRACTVVWVAAWLQLLAACGGSGGGSAPALVDAEAEPPVLQLSGPGEFKNALALKGFSVGELQQAVQSAGARAPALLLPRYAVQTYKIDYLTRDGRDQTVLASALVTVPQKPAGQRSPVLSYQHATIKRDADAPSNKISADQAPILLASLGYIVLAADYVGFGSSKGAPHPYLLAGPTAAAVLDALSAARYWRYTQGLRDNRQLFLAGYSQGGHASLAAARALEQAPGVFGPQLRLTVAGGGPYIVQLVLDDLLDQIMARQPVLGLLLSPGLLKLLGDSDRRRVRDLLLREMLGDEADVTLMPDVLDLYLMDDEAGLEARSHVHRWLSSKPLRLFHGRDDLTVSYRTASTTLATMQALGASAERLRLSDCPAQPAGHLECVGPFLEHMLREMAAVATDL